MKVKFVSGVLWWLWLAVDPKGCLTATATKREREAMGVKFDD